MSPSITVRLDAELGAAVNAEAARLGLTRSEYVRQALMARLAWSLALWAVEEGADPADLARFGTLDAAAIARIARRIK